MTTTTNDSPKASTAGQLLPAARLEPRVPCGLDAVLQVDGKQRNVYVLNISRSGALIEVSPMPPKDAVITLSIDFPHGAAALQGRVVRQLQFEAGLHFDELSREQLALLEKYVFLRTCQFGWLNHRRWFLNRDSMLSAVSVTFIACVVLSFGGVSLLQRFGFDLQTAPAAVAAYAVAALSPFCYVATVAFALLVGPDKWRDYLVFGRDPELTYRAQLDAIRKAFGFSRLELDALKAIHPRSWGLASGAIWMFTQLFIVFVLFQWGILAALRWYANN